MAIHPPLNNPCFCNASKLYCEQVGWYLQVAGVSGDMKFWYNRIMPTKGAISIFFMDGLMLKI